MSKHDLPELTGAKLKSLVENFADLVDATPLKDLNKATSQLDNETLNSLGSLMEVVRVATTMIEESLVNKLHENGGN